MKFTSLTPMLWTEKLDETIAFYTQILGFTCGERDENWGWAALHKDEVEIMLAKPNARRARSTGIKVGFFWVLISLIYYLSRPKIR